MSEWPRDYQNPSQEYLDLEKKHRDYVNGESDKMKLSYFLFKGVLITRAEFATCVELRLVTFKEDSKENYEKFMSQWKETKDTFGYMGYPHEEDENGYCEACDGLCIKE